MIHGVWSEHKVYFGASSSQAKRCGTLKKYLNRCDCGGGGLMVGGVGVSGD